MNPTEAKIVELLNTDFKGDWDVLLKTVITLKLKDSPSQKTPISAINPNPVQQQFVEIVPPSTPENLTTQDSVIPTNQSVAPPQVIQNTVTANPMIELKAVTKNYAVGSETIAALNNINLTILQGEFVAIVGPSGSGKSTLLQLLGGLDKQTSGEIVVDSQNLNNIDDNALSRYRNTSVGFIFQSFYLQPYLNVLKNVELPLLFKDLQPEVRKHMAKEAVQSVGLTDRINHLPKQLSGGQMQRVAVARALANKPKIILADEPTANLDKTNTIEIGTLLQEVNSKLGVTIVLVTHNELLASYAKRIINIEGGQIR